MKEPKKKSAEIVKYTKQDFVTKFEPSQMLTEFKHIRNTTQAIQADANGLSFYSKQLGYDTVLAVVELHVVSLVGSINITKTLTTFQIKEIAIEVLSEFFYLSVVEIGYVFRKAKRGEYGKLYGALSIMDVLTWFKEYSEERAIVFVQESTKDRHNDSTMRSEEREQWNKHEQIINKLKK